MEITHSTEPFSKPSLDGIDGMLKKFIETAHRRAGDYMKIKNSPKYPDRFEMSDIRSPVTFFTDQHGRHGVILALEVNTCGVYEGATLVVFNRYSDRPCNWQGSQSPNYAWAYGSGFPKEELARAYELLTGGSVVLGIGSRSEWKGSVVSLANPRLMSSLGFENAH